MKKTIKKMKILLLLAAMLLPLCANGQQYVRTVHGDYNMDGTFGMDDLTALINYLVFGSWNDYPKDLQRDTVSVNGVEFVMVKVDGGSYALEESVTATVGDFWIGQTEVTYELWAAVMGTTQNPSYYLQPWAGMTWESCQSFISKLNELTGRTFRLPSSIEWEWAARGGNYSHGYEYAGSNSPALVAHCSFGTHVPNPQNVALLHPNELGLYDMSGNVSEWCQNAWNGSSSLHIVRGGGSKQTANECKVSWTGHYYIKPDNGMRLAM